jgi:hypothetical protein
LLPNNHWREKFFQGSPGGFRPLFTVERALARSALAPSFGTVFVYHARQDDPTFSRTAETCLEKMNERQTNLSQLNRKYDH